MLEAQWQMISITMAHALCCPYTLPPIHHEEAWRSFRSFLAWRGSISGAVDEMGLRRLAIKQDFACACRIGWGPQKIH